MKILLLEDNQTLNETIKLKLELKGYDVEVFSDGLKAYEAITDGFSCFILDINVPNIDGIKILKKIREYYDEVPVIIISATVELDILKKAYDFGCNDYLKKPFFIDELEIKIEKLLNISDKTIKIEENCFYNYSKNSLIIDASEIILTKKENLLVNLFIKNKNQLISYDSIQNYVWEGEYASLDAIRTLVRRVKNKLKLKDSQIKASFNRGYYFKNYL